MKKRQSTRIFAIFLALLLCIPLLGLSAAATEDVSAADPTGTAESPETSETSPIFILSFNNSDEVYAFTAFYVQDTQGDGSTYLVTAGSASVPAEAGYEAVLLGDNFAEYAEYLGKVGYFAYFSAPRLEGITPLALGNAFTETVQVAYQTVTEESQIGGVVTEDIDMTTGWEDHVTYYLAPGTQMEDTYFMGAPILETAEGGVVGCVTQDDDHQLVILSMVDITFPREAVIAAGGETAPEAGTEPVPEEPAAAKDYTKYIYIGIGVLVVVSILIAANRKPAKKRSETGAVTGSTYPQGTVTLEPMEFETNSLVSEPVPFNPPAEFQSSPIPAPVPPPVQPAAAQWQVRCLEGDLEGKTFLLYTSLRFGRSTHCDVVFPKTAPGVSGTHCELSVEDGRVVLRDLQSSYGTYLSKHVRMEPQVNYHLQVGDTFSLAEDGPTFRLEKVGASFQEATPAVRSSDGGTVYRADMNGRMVFGRDARNQVTFPKDDSSVSTIHCTLYREGSTLYLVDNGSTNGTFFSENQRLKPNVPYKVKKGMAFFLVSPKNTFVITED